MSIGIMSLRCCLCCKFEKKKKMFRSDKLLLCTRDSAPLKVNERISEEMITYFLIWAYAGFFFVNFRPFLIPMSITISSIHIK